MRIAAIICNTVLFLFTCMVIVTDGPPMRIAYTVFTFWVLGTLVLSPIALSLLRSSAGGAARQTEAKAFPEQKDADGSSRVGAILKMTAIGCNIVFFGFVCWAIADQYPHPDEEGVVAFMILMVITPLLSLVALIRSRASMTGRAAV